MTLLEEEGETPMCFFICSVGKGGGGDTTRALGNLKDVGSAESAIEDDDDMVMVVVVVTVLATTGGEKEEGRW